MKCTLNAGIQIFENELQKFRLSLKGCYKSKKGAEIAHLDGYKIIFMP